MVLIEWRESFRVGVPAVDTEHRELIELINETYARVRADEPDSTILDFLGEIYARIAAHFALEERLMREQNYDQYEDHKADHERLLDEIRDIMDEYEDGILVSEEDLSRRLETWFTEHFRTRDARLHKFLR